MDNPSHPGIDFSQVQSRIVSGNSWHFDTSANRKRIADVSGAVRIALRSPADFPPFSAAVAPGDRVALAVDPNLPSLREVIRGVLSEIEEAGGEAVDVVLWDEATDATIEMLEAEFANRATIIRHKSADRESLRYLGADVDAEPVYVNRAVADADLVLPIVTARPWDAAAGRHLSGVYPMLTDANTRIRHLESLWKSSSSKSKENKRTQNETQIGWMLGVQVMLAVAANEDSLAGSVFAGTPDTIRRSFDLVRNRDDEFPPSAKLVIASLEGDQQQQTWPNLARAAMAAAAHVAPDGTILIWSQIDTPPSDRLIYRLNSDDAPDDLREDADEDGFEAAKSADGFTIWDESVGLARTLQRVLAESRVLLKSELDHDSVEALGLGAIESLDGVEHLTKSFADCETFRAAQFASGTFDSLGFDSLPPTEKRSS